ncbi:16S rRNA (cytosine(967)-C(5))-methyltransferase RsmB [bacterium]|nr:16S rRNA (cytosine(967)-C(5))-methyltransferase RsmB [bacterium]NIN92348.1 16S rRNA (cytosine(967)-C(5))-methyltransferase RsmB [bacterium]NIO18462.1 16S rRNA (cytosine(967)-C(5))-methyltransferase RsmB [bacterium]NIO73458.1 16S rRNA (cytosine(967)-C(5))-methyltransferase RsmB [bacterium]
MKSARKIALEVLYKIETKNAYSRVALDSALSSHELSKEDRALVTELVYGVIRRLNTLDWVLNTYSFKQKIEEFSPYVRNILRLGAYQLMYLDKIPAYAAINESVEMSKEFGHTGIVSLINAVLRAISNNLKDIHYPDQQKNLSQYLSIVYSHPQWLITRWLSRLGEKETIKLCEINNQAPPLSIRINTLKTTREEIIPTLKEEDLKVEVSAVVPGGLKIRDFISLTQLESFRRGLFTVQGESSQLISHILAPEPGETVLDACAAPGGKTTHIAELMKNTGSIIALDIRKPRVEMIKENCRRLGVTNVKAELLDATKVSSLYSKKVDRCLVDAPCSSLGIIQSQPEVRWNRDYRGTLVKMPQLQYAILSEVSLCVKPKGVLVYAVCSLEPEEGEKIIEKFLKERPLFHLESVKPYLPVSKEELVDENGFLKIYPHRHHMDGMFACRMVRM